MSGTCERHGYISITDKTKCESGAEYLGLKSTNAKTMSWNGLQNGCVFTPDGNAYLEINSKDVVCGVRAPIYQYNCICLVQGMKLD